MFPKKSDITCLDVTKSMFLLNADKSKLKYC